MALVGRNFLDPLMKYVDALPTLEQQITAEQQKGLDEQRKKRGRASTQLTGNGGISTQTASIVSAGRTLLGGY